MARYSSDNRANRTEFIWRGQPGWGWPFEARGKAWILGFVLVITFTVFAGALWSVPARMAAPGPAGMLLTAILSLLTAPLAAVYVTRWVGRFDTAVAPRKYHLRVLASEIMAPRPEPVTTTDVMMVPVQAAEPHNHPTLTPPEVTTRSSNVESQEARAGRHGWRRQARRAGYAVRIYRRR